jgi:hypothetical protein
MFSVQVCRHGFRASYWVILVLIEDQHRWGEGADRWRQICEAENIGVKERELKVTIKMATLRYVAANSLNANEAISCSGDIQGNERDI